MNENKFSPHNKCEHCELHNLYSDKTCRGCGTSLVPTNYLVIR